MDGLAKIHRVNTICEGLTALCFTPHVLCSVLLDQSEETLDAVHNVVIAALGKREQGGQR